MGIYTAYDRKWFRNFSEINVGGVMEFKGEVILDVAMEIGMNLLRCGAEIRRVEDTITYICKAYGASEVDVFAIPTLIIATIEVDGQSYTTKVKRNLNVTTDLYRLEKYNKLSRKICKETPTLDKVKEEVERIQSLKDYNLLIVYVGAILAASGFALFFGGSYKDAISAGIVSIIMTLFLRIKIEKMNQFVHILICSLIGGFCSLCMSWIGLVDNLSYVMSGGIMIIIPGLAIGTSIRDIMSNDILSGSVRLFQAVVTSAAIATGFSVFAEFYSGPIEMTATVEWWMVLITAFFSTLGFAIIFNNKYSHLWIVSLCGVAACVAYIFPYYASNNTFFSVMMGTVLATFLAEILARVLKAPTTVFLLPAIIPFVPGARLFFTMYSLINSDFTSFKDNFLELMLASLGIAVGIILASVVTQLILNAIKKLKTKN